MPSERVIVQFLLLILVVVISPAWGQTVTEEPVFADRILAVVDDDPILNSEVEQIIGLGLIAKQEGEGDEGYRRRVFDLLVEQRLRFHEIDRFGLSETPVDEIDEQLDLLKESFGTAEEFENKLRELDLSEDSVRQLLAHQLMVWIYVDERLGPRVFVSLEDIREYYEQVLVPELEAGDSLVPPVAEVREEIRRVLKEKRLNEELIRWTEELRREADVVDYFDSTHDELPPVVSTSGIASDGN